MARSARQIRRSPSPSSRQLGRFKPGTTFDATILLVVLALAAGLGFGFAAPARQWAANTLGFGWIPVAALTLSTLLALRYRPRWLLVHWRWWVGAAAVVVTTVGMLSFFYPRQGILSLVSLGGRWGEEIGGGSLPLGVLKLVAFGLLVPLVLYPKRVGNYYLRAMGGIGRGVRFIVFYLGLAFLYPLRYLAPRVGRLFNSRYRRRQFRKLEFLLSRLFSPGTSTPEAAADWDTDEFPSSDQTDRVEVTEGVPIDGQESAEASDSPDGAALKTHPKSQWKLPSLNLLSPPQPHAIPQTPLQQMARHIESTLAEHGVMVEVQDIKAGPRIVRFGLVPGWVPKRGDSPPGSPEGTRVKVQSILTREKDLALALKTPHLRIEAPVPGEALVGLEVPAPSQSKVPLRAVMDIPDFQEIASKGGLPIALGQDTGGNPVVTDLAALPHLLIAGATGSGKSVCINSIVASLLFTKPPDQMRMLMVDPKRVELTPFNGIPHLITPVIVDVEEVNPALRALMAEMLRRYKQMEEVGTRNIAGYNAKTKERMPYLVLIVDELADLMMVGGFEIEQNLVRLAQLGRATGIHLVLATQRPSVNVVTGLLKANIASRVAFAVASQVDSRVILDTVGAEKLLGRGDMLLLNSDSPKPRRVQGTLVYDEEIDKVVEFWLKQKGPPLPIIPLEDTDGVMEDPDEVDDRILDSARELAIRNPHLSSSFLERRLRIGGQKAAQVMELLEDEGLVIPG